jgi:predicted ester cyclase
MRFVVRGTHQGEFMGIPATGRAIAMDSMGIGTVRDGRVTRLVALPNLLGMMQQLGVIPAPAAV